MLAAALVPVGMAYAELSGLPPVYGLYASLLPLLAYALFGPSRVLVMGPDSSTAPLVAAAIIPLALADPSQRIALAGMLALLVGVMSLVVGVARLGFVAALLSKPVRLGYMNGIAVVVVVSQLPKLLGFKAPAEGVFLQIIEFGRGLGSVNPVAAALGVSSLVIILVLRALMPKVPGPLVVVVLGSHRIGRHSSCRPTASPPSACCRRDCPCRAGPGSGSRRLLGSWPRRSVSP